MPPKPPTTKRQSERPWKGWQKVKKINYTLAYKKKKKYLKRKQSTNPDNNLAKNIVNLSSYNLSTHEISILGKGLCFIPKPKHVDTNDIMDGIAKLKSQMISKTETKQRITLASTIPDNYNPWQTIRAFNLKKQC